MEINQSSTSDQLAATQGALPISLIATPRAALLTCGLNEKVTDVVERYLDFDHIPVTSDGTPGGRFLGMLDAHRFRNCAEEALVERAYAPLSEEQLIGSDAPIIEFLWDAADRGSRLLVSGKHISGLVTLSDIQAISARAALFTLITRLELVMVEWLRTMGEADSDVWMGRLANRKQARVRKQITIAKEGDAYVDDLSCTYLDDKGVIVSASPKFRWDGQAFEEAMSATIKLRNALSHAQEYAATRKHALRVCSTVRTISHWIETLAPRG